MAATNKWRINNPVASTRYNAPNGFFVIPNNASSTTLNFQSAAAVNNATLFSHNQTANTDPFSLNLGSGISSGNIVTSTGHNGTDVFTVGFSFTGAAPAWIDLWFSVYTGTAYPLLKVRRTAAWVNLDGSKILIRRSGAWVQVNQLLVRRTGAWKSP
jgi:hypothetical protein